MSNNEVDIDGARKELNQEFDNLDDKTLIVKSKVFKSLYADLAKLPDEQKASAGQAINKLKEEFADKADQAGDDDLAPTRPIDLTAPFDVNVKPENRPALLPAEHGSQHPLTKEME